MKIIVLGSSADKGFFHRKGKDRRTRASIAIKHKDKTLVTDAGPDFFRQIKRENIIPDSILLTHSHPDHIAALKKRAFQIPVYASKSTWTELPQKISDNCQNKKTLLLEKELNLAGLKIIPFKVDHSDRVKMVGFKINGFVYIPEQRNLTKSAEKYMKGAKILVLDGAIMDRDLNVHSSIKTKLKWLKKLNPKKVYFTNIGRNTAKRSHKELINYLKNQDSKIDVFYDGLVLNM